MNIAQTELPGVLLLTPRIFGDSRGAFWETYNQKVFADAGLPTEWVQDNTSRSVRNVIRGIHYQIVQPQAKLVRAGQGRILDVAIDLRRSSPHFGRHIAIELTWERGEMLYIPAGFGHGFVTLTDEASMAYKVTDYYCPSGERTLLWSDPALGIQWGVDQADAIVSEKDRHGVLLRDAEVFD